MNSYFYFSRINIHTKVILGQYGKCIYNFTRNCQSVLQTGHIISHPHQLKKALVVLHHCQHLVFSVFLVQPFCLVDVLSCHGLNLCSSLAYDLIIIYLLISHLHVLLGKTYFSLYLGQNSFDFLYVLQVLFTVCSLSFHLLNGIFYRKYIFNFEKNVLYHFSRLHLWCHVQ